MGSGLWAGSGQSPVKLFPSTMDYYKGKHWEKQVVQAFWSLVHLDHTVDLIYKPEAGKEADGT